MKAITISQPYASLIANGDKWVENRTWYTPYRGLLAIHAGKGTQYLDGRQLAEYPTGGFIAVAELVTCVTLKELRLMWRPGQMCGNRLAVDLMRHEHTEGPVCWVLENVAPLPEIVPCRGRQGLWEVPAELV